MSGVRDTDQGANAFVARLRALDGAKVRVGVLDDAPKRESDGASGPLSLLEVAAIHEFGAPAAGIPQRSFIRATADERRTDIGALQAALAEQVAAGKASPEQALELMGAKVASMVQAKINSGIAPPLAPETVARKGSSQPLVSTGQLKSSITWKVGA